MVESTDSKFTSRKFMLVAGINALSTILLVTKNITSSEWVDTSRWSLSSYLAANVLGDKVSFHGEA